MMTVKLCLTLLLASSSLGQNVIENGDFASGELSPWTCPQSQCTILAENQLGMMHIEP